MIFSEQRLIYLHVPKTGGNSISRVLLPYSDDKMTTDKHQDGADRFGIKGSVTPHKHAALGVYKNVLGKEFNSFHVAISVRDPLDRAISMYYSPHRWMKQIDGEWVQETPYWDFDRFSRTITNMLRIADFLHIRRWRFKTLRLPDHVIRFENLATDIHALTQAYGLPFDMETFPHANKSTAAQGEREEIKSLAPVRALVQQRFSADYRLLERID